MAKQRAWLLPLLFFLFTFFSISIAGDTLAADQSIRDKDGESLVSAGGRFKLGFFRPGTSKNRYLGIWFNNIPPQTVVWVANRITPLTNSTGILEIGNSTGNLILRYETGGIVWSSVPSTTSNLVAQLLDSGNFVLRDERSDNLEDFVWQSFNHPTDTAISGMNLGWDSKTGEVRRLVAWTSDDDPSPGNCNYGLDLHGVPQLVLNNNGTWVSRTGPWNGVQLSGVTEMDTNPGYTFYFNTSRDGIYHTYVNKNPSLISRFVVKQQPAILQSFFWINGGWSVYWSWPFDPCDRYGPCGPYGVCKSDDVQICHCFQGFQPKVPAAWNLLDGSKGCERRTPLDCRKGNGFLNVTNLKVPDTSSSIANTSMTIDECRAACLQNCNCTAYAPSDIRGTGSGCIMWVGDLLDTREYTDRGQYLFLRLPDSEIDALMETRTSTDSGNTIAILTGTIVAVMLLLGCSLCCIWKRNSNICVKLKLLVGIKDQHGSNEDIEIPLFDRSNIAIATNHFSIQNKLGEGGFGPVYKGKLAKGQEIAVKRLSRNSGQGPDEFMNEVMLIAKLQHRNLVKLLGCCIHREERMLIYEYMPNKSLDTFIFDNSRRILLVWQIRFDIIMGIARGLLYLHQDSRLRIIHRDLKASNILLDRDLNPKISDFGTARIFRVDQMKDKTKIVVGTYGYMSPEYVIDGIFSMKSDVFSFGVLVLEILTGKKNRGVYEENLNVTLLGYAWKLWNEGNSLELLDEAIPSCNIAEVLRCIHVGLLCVQEHAKDRPEMASVAFMLGSNAMELPPPKRPGFCTEIIADSSKWLFSGRESHSASELTVTMVVGR